LIQFAGLFFSWIQDAIYDGMNIVKEYGRYWAEFLA
jgi:hypothetical protein